MPSTDPPTANGDSAPAPPRIGPHPGFISSSNQYGSEIKLRRMLKDNGCDPAREDNYRLQGVQLIDNVREHLQLPVRTFDTACTYFHKFRLNFRDSEYNYQDAALASLFVACKVEDTIKKSKDILVAAYSVKNPDKPTAPDDKFFDGPGKVIIGLERLILETVGFDFRTRYPQKLLVKVVRRILGTAAPARAFFATAYAMCIDMYKTFVPVKRTTFAMVLAVVELTARMRGGDDVLARVRRFAASRGKQCSRDAVTETMLDLLDLYVQHHKATKIGAAFDLATFIDIKIRLNTDLDAAAAPRYLFHCSRCDVADPNPLDPVSAASPAAAGSAWPPDASVRRTARGQDGTMRFIFDPEAARVEQQTAGAYFREEYEEYEVEVEEPLPPPHERDGGGGGGGGGGAWGGYRGGHRDRGDHRRGGPYGGYRGDRHHRGRGRYH
ncbi:CTD kinase subunit beta [Tolypocladium paradoxum]|uniref:RNA polymerase II holoenzyme cyclin-like subunit n=1 Tax=Tolypocladium paradoxum TaxID=94208 RepID=A0A2S4KV02_9HYPO|nr:CTD kinase subunit beta [Tolypocladium paradoxum]